MRVKARLLAAAAVLGAVFAVQSPEAVAAPNFQVPIKVSVGQHVSLGQQFGEAGATGGVTGSHLHYEQRLNGTTRKAVLDGGSSSYTSPFEHCD